MRRDQRKKVALILGGVRARGQKRRRGVFRDSWRADGFHARRAGRGIGRRGGHKARIMSRGQPIGPQCQRGILKGGEFDVPVAEGAGIGRVSPRIGGGKGVHDRPPERFPQIRRVKFQTEAPAGGAQALGGGRIGGGVRKKESVQRQHLVAFPRKAQQGAQAVHTAADGDGYAHGPVSGREGAAAGERVLARAERIMGRNSLSERGGREKRGARY